VRPELRPVSCSHGLEASPRVGALVVLPTVRWVDWSAWVLLGKTPSLRRYGPKSPGHFPLRPVPPGARLRPPTRNEVDTLSPADDCTTRRNGRMATIPAATPRAVVANGTHDGVPPGTPRYRGAIARRSAQRGWYELYQTRSRSTIPTIGICLIARRMRWRTSRSPIRGSTPI